MFQKALEVAAAFTFPIVVSRKTVGGHCSSTIGTGVVINEMAGSSQPGIY
jgi:hypothetical protein